MAEAGTLHDAFIDELRDTYDAERQLTKALPKLAKAATAPELREAFESHLQETQGQIERLEQVFESLDEKVRGKHCDGIAGIIEEGKSIMEEDFDGDTMDACLIAAGQRAEHYEMAAYGTLVAWARVMGHTKAADLLQENLDEEKAADEKLSGLAEGGINQGAADAAHPDEDEEPVAVGAASKKSRGRTGKLALAGGSTRSLQTSDDSIETRRPKSLESSEVVPLHCPRPSLSTTCSAAAAASRNCSSTRRVRSCSSPTSEPVLASMMAWRSNTISNKWAWATSALNHPWSATLAG